MSEDWAVHIDFAGEFKPGDPRPKGYMDCYEWAEVQEKAGLKQKACGVCGKWNYPQELSGREAVTVGKARNGRVYEIRSPICKECDAKGDAS